MFSSHVGTCWEKKHAKTVLHQRQGTRKIKRSSLTFEMVLTSDTSSHTVFKGRAPCTAPHSLKLIYPLKIAGLEDEFPFGARPIFRGENVSFREGNVFDWWWGPLLVLWNYWMLLLKRVLPSSILSWFGCKSRFSARVSLVYDLGVNTPTFKTGPIRIKLGGFGFLQDSYWKIMSKASKPQKATMVLERMETWINATYLSFPNEIHVRTPWKVLVATGFWNQTLPVAAKPRLCFQFRAN